MSDACDEDVALVRNGWLFKCLCGFKVWTQTESGVLAFECMCCVNVLLAFSHHLSSVLSTAITPQMWVDQEWGRS